MHIETNTVLLHILYPAILDIFIFSDIGDYACVCACIPQKPKQLDYGQRCSCKACYTAHSVSVCVCVRERVGQKQQGPAIEAPAARHCDTYTHEREQLQGFRQALVLFV